MTEKLTKAQHKAMAWVKANEPVSTFPCDGSAPDMRFVTRRLVDLGYVERVGKEAGKPFGFSRFALTPAGRTALAKSEGRS